MNLLKVPVSCKVSLYTHSFSYNNCQFKQSTTHLSGRNSGWVRTRVANAPLLLPSPDPSANLGPRPCPVSLREVGCYKDKRKASKRAMRELLFQDRYEGKGFSGQKIDWTNWKTYMPEWVRGSLLLSGCCRLKYSSYFMTRSAQPLLPYHSNSFLSLPLKLSPSLYPSSSPFLSTSKPFPFTPQPLLFPSPSPPRQGASG